MIGDARRRSWFLAQMRQRRLAGEILLMEKEELEGRVRKLCADGEAVVTFDDEAPGFGDGTEIVMDAPSAAGLAAHAAAWNAEAFAALAGEPLEPIYLRAPYITEPKGE